MDIATQGGFVSFSSVPKKQVTDFFNSNAVRFEMNFHPYLELHKVRQEEHLRPILGWTCIEQRTDVEKLRELWDTENQKENLKQESISLLTVRKMDIALALFCWAQAPLLQSLSAVFLTEEGEQVIFIPNARGVQHFVQVVEANIDVYAGENLVFPIYNPLDNERIAA